MMNPVRKFIDLVSRRSASFWLMVSSSVNLVVLDRYGVEWFVFGLFLLVAVQLVLEGLAKYKVPDLCAGCVIVKTGANGERIQCTIMGLFDIDGRVYYLLRGDDGITLVDAIAVVEPAGFAE